MDEACTCDTAQLQSEYFVRAVDAWRIEMYILSRSADPRALFAGHCAEGEQNEQLHTETERPRVTQSSTRYIVWDHNGDNK
jgi:hypothetical protein